MNRREFIQKFSLLSLGLSTIPALLANNKSDDVMEGLIKDPAGIIDLPKHFSYSIISSEKDLMNDGLLVPPNADGMTCLSLDEKRVVLIRNHEIGHVPRLSTFFKNNPFGEYYRKYKKNNANKFYDINGSTTHCFGGTTSIVYNIESEEVENQYLSLAGTLVNCSGGKTPWNTWISCEETTIREGIGITKNHGYNFEVVPSLKSKLNKAIPLKAMGRFRHEGVAFDDSSGYVYQTEDRSDGLFYRFIPNVKNKLDQGGKLQILSFRDWRGIDTRNWDKKSVIIGEKYKVRWIDIDNVDSPEDNLRYRGNNKGGAVFARGEGIFLSDNVLFFTATTGGKNKTGQVWKYIPDSQTIELFYESDNADVLNLPDNIILSPNGSVILCEDGKGRDRLVCIKKDKTISYLANNAYNNQELAGACFSPNNKILFINMYKPTMTIAIKGPWKEI